MSDDGMPDRVEEPGGAGDRSAAARGDGAGNGTGQGTGQGGGRSWLGWALALSLLANLALAGVLAGGIARGHMRGADVRGAGFGPLSAAMTRQDRQALRDAFKAAGQGWAAYRNDARADYADLARLMATEPFDRAAAEAVLTRQAARTEGRMGQAQSLLLDHIASMTPADRAAFAARLSAVLTKAD